MPKVIDPKLRMYYGKIEGSNSHGNILSYDVSLDGVHTNTSNPIQRSKGIPVFSYGYNSIRYDDGTRVVCICKGSDYSEVWILGEVIDLSNKKDIPVPGKGEIGKRMNSEENSGMTPLGKSDQVLLWAKEGRLKLSDKYLNLDFGNKSALSVTGETLTYSGNGTYSLGSTFTAYNTQGFYFNSPTSLFFIQSKGLKVASTAPSSISAPSLELKGGELVGSYSSIRFSSSINYKGPKDAISFSALSGNMNFSIGKGDFKVGTADPLTSNIKMYIGFPTKMATFNMSKDGIEMQGGLSPASSSIKLGGSSSPKIELDAFDNISIKTKTGDILIDATTGDIEINVSAMGKIKLNGDTEIDGDLSVTGDIDGDKEVSAQAATAATKVKLSTHKHVSSAPGAPSPPIPG
jgi:hypothetical protein